MPVGDGDGDGNENANVHVLKQTVIQLKQRIKQLSSDKLKQIQLLIVAEKETIIDIVTLSESVKDLEELPNLMSELIDDPIYRKHLFYREKLIVIIAKSDTVRRNGRGAESSQE
ncbi:unnamed protein product [Rotaria sp. Silwood2]|nr:unnamed protein product [Rotaria sp. Silwood2]